MVPDHDPSWHSDLRSDLYLALWSAMGDHILWCFRQDRHVCVEVGWTYCYNRSYLAGLTFDTAVVKLLRVFETRKGITSAQNRNNGLLSIQTLWSRGIVIFFWSDIHH